MEVNLAGKRILVTGATGYVGSWLAELARQNKASVRIAVRRIPPFLEQWASNFEVVQADVNDIASMRVACRDCDIVWHAASVNETVCRSDVNQAIAVNVTGAINAMEAALNEKVGCFAKLSTFHVYGYSGAASLDESFRPSPSSVYGLTNLMADTSALYYRRTKGLNVVIPRISNGYGAPLFRQIDRWSLVVNSLCKMAIEKKKIELLGTGLDERDFVSIQDVFKALVLITTKPHDEAVVNVGGHCSRSIREVAALIQFECQKRFGETLPVTTKPVAAGEVGQAVDFDISKLGALGYSPTDIMGEEISKLLSLLED